MKEKILSVFKDGRLQIAGALLGLYLLSTGVSFAAFSFLLQAPTDLVSPVSLSEKREGIDLTGPKTEVCPLTGEKFTQAEREIWQTRRPLGIVIENHEEARPQSGLSRADIVYEAVAEGGITRFLAIYYCGAAREEVLVGPVRSARSYFLDWISEYGDFPLFTHVGGANRPGPADALGQIASYGWLSARNDLNQFAIGFPTFWRDYERLGHPVATEHTMYSTTDKLWDEAKERGLTEKGEEGKSWDENFVSWRFEEQGEPQTQNVLQISYPFWEGYEEYNVRWEYDSASGYFKRSNGGSSLTDLNTNQQIEAKNVVVLFTSWRSLGDPEKHILYKTTGTGRALVFKEGRVVEGTWQKSSRLARTKFLDENGREISLAPGNIWIGVLATGTQVTY